jgi:hypothetical protein
MKVEAYKCDYCKGIFEADLMQGVKNEADLFESSASFPTIKPDKADIHFCMECYRVNVEMHIKNRMKWKDGEKYDQEREKLKWQLHKEYFFIFKKETIRRHFEAKSGRKK